jgi:hypothetical protein
MRIITFIIILFVSLTSFAHRGDFLAISNVEITETESSYIYSFQVENINSVEVRDIKIEFVVNSKSVFQKYYPLLKAEHNFFNEQFEVPKKWINPKVDLVQIEITEIFGKKDDWGGWDSPTFKQVNTALSEFMADSPWRMKKTDGAGNIQGIPVHMFLHDADEVIGTSPQIDYINVKVKNVTDNSFGPVLTYNSMNSNDFENLFSCMAVADGGMNVRGFSYGDISTSTSYTFDFDIDTDWLGGDYLEVSEDFYYFTFTIPPSDLVGLSDVVDIEVTCSYDNVLPLPWSDDVIRLRVFRSDEDIPVQSNFYRGDTHLHSMFTQNDAEVGLPLCGTKEAGQLIGLDWITTTDHTSDFDNYGGGNINTNWDRIKAEAALNNALDPSLIYIPGQEVAVDNSNSELVHMLAYPSYTSVSTFPFMGDGNGDLTGTSKTVDIVADQLASFGGFSYAAHPFATESKLPTFPVGGGIWNLGHAGFTINGLPFPETGGNIIANAESLDSDILYLQNGILMDNGKLIKDGIKGTQIWNVRNTLSTAGDANDPWDVLYVSDPFTQFDTASYSFHIKKFRQGQEITNYINQLGLQLKNGDSTYQNWKMYISAGADAHGSFNFSNTNDFASLGTINNNAVGKLSTLAYSEEGMGANGENVLKAMFYGNTTLSDGPILSIGVSDDGDNTSNEIFMGEDAIVNTLLIDDYYFNMHYTTTAEFGEVTKITMIVGTETGETRKTISLGPTAGDNEVSYTLTDVLDLVLGAGNTPQDEYFYVRAEMQTFIDYTGQELIRRTDFDYFHSFTNPIWVKLSEVITATIEDVAVIGPNPFNDSFSLYVSNPDQEEVTVEMFNDIGQLIFQEARAINETGVEYSAEELGLSIGMYTVKVYVGNVNKAIKIVKD